MVVNRREVLKVTALAGLASPTVVRAQNPQSTDGAGTKYAFSKDGTRIAYQVIGAGPTLVMQHGFGQDRNTWLVNRYAEALTERFRLLLIDAKGHGESGGPASQDAYSHARCAQDVAAVVEAECDEPPTFWGYSMGGRIGFSCMAYTPDLYRSFVIGAHYSSLFEISEAATKSRIARAKKFEKGLEALGAEEQERFMNANLPAFAAYSRSVAVFDPTLRDMLSTFSGPTLFYVGGEDAERLRNLEARHGRRLIEYLTNPTFVEIPGGLGHGETHRRSDLVLPHVLRFLAQA